MPHRSLAVLVGAVLAFAAASRASAEETRRRPRARLPWVIELVGGLGVPPTTFTIGLGARGRLGDRLGWRVHLEGLSVFGRVDLSGDGVDDYRPSTERAAHAAVAADATWPLLAAREAGRYYRSYSGALRGGVRATPLGLGPIVVERDLALVVGSRATLSGTRQAAVAVGLRLAAREYTDRPRDLEERWVQLRALAFVVPRAIGFDAEAAWLPVGAGLFVQFFPRLDHDAPPARCVEGVDVPCESFYPTTFFNPIPYGWSLQAGIRLHLQGAR